MSSISILLEGQGLNIILLCDKKLVLLLSLDIANLLPFLNVETDSYFLMVKKKTNNLLPKLI